MQQRSENSQHDFKNGEHLPIRVQRRWPLQKRRDAAGRQIQDMNAALSEAATSPAVPGFLLQ
jgi:hypothetical protein